MVCEEETLQTAPAFAGLDSSPADIDAARYVVIPVPYEATTEWLAGTRHGPGRIIDSSRLLELYDQEVDADISQAGIATAPALEPVLSGPYDMVAAVQEQIATWLARGKTPVMIGGEHTVNTRGPSAPMRGTIRDISVLHLDAHCRPARFVPRSALTASNGHCGRVHELCTFFNGGRPPLSTAERHYITEQRIPAVFWPPKTSDWLDREYRNACHRIIRDHRCRCIR
jgi:hypothetical protein